MSLNQQQRNELIKARTITYGLEDRLERLCERVSESCEHEDNQECKVCRLFAMIAKLPHIISEFKDQLDHVLESS